MPAQSKITFSSLIVIVAILVSSLGYSNPIIPIPVQPQQPSFTPGIPNLDVNGFILMDVMSGKILAEKRADDKIPPASLTKLMSLYVISSAIKSGQIRLTDKVRISTKAWKTEGSRMFVKAGEEVPVKTLLEGIIVASGNDATVALAEHIAGTEEAFVAIMNEEAKLLGLKNTHFVDSTGLPNKDHYSSPHDLALLTQSYIKNFPEDYSFYSEKWFSYNGVRQPNRNRLLWRYQYADGLKTGHTNEAGYCLVGSAKKDGMRLISVIMGAKTDQARTEDSIRLLTYGFRFFETHKIFTAAAPLLKARTWEGEETETPLGISDDFYVTIPSGQYKKLQTAIELTNALKAPIVKGQDYGVVKAMLNNQIIAIRPLIALQNNTSGNLWRRAADSVRFNIHKYFAQPDNKVNTG